MASAVRKFAVAAVLSSSALGMSALPAAAKAQEPPACKSKDQSKYYLNGTSRHWYFTGASNISGGRRYSFNVTYRGWGGDSYGKTWCDVRA